MKRELEGAVVRVGKGRGFVVGAGDKRLIITAAHCLPQFPPAASISYVAERTYPALLGPLDGGKTKVWAECLFADPVGDIAVLGSPDDQELSNEAEAYNVLTERDPPLRVNDRQLPPKTKISAWLMGLDGDWGRCTVKSINATLWIEDALDGIHGGMSGSPILDDGGTAIGVVVAGHTGKSCTSGGPNPSLPGNLPEWFLREFSTP